MALQYARLIFDEVPVSDVGPSRSFERFSCILFCCETLDLLSGATAARIRDYVANGGSIAVVYRGWSDDLCELFGIEYPGGWPDFSLADEEGLNFVSDLFPAFHDLQLTSDDIWGHAPLDIRPKPDCEVIATNARGRPLAWLNHWQDGRVVYWNTVALGEKRLRGLIIQSVACAQQTSVLPLANVGVVQVDDYPPALWTDFPSRSQLNFRD